MVRGVKKVEVVRVVPTNIYCPEHASSGITTTKVDDDHELSEISEIIIIIIIIIRSATSRTLPYIFLHPEIFIYTILIHLAADI